MLRVSLLSTPVWYRSMPLLLLLLLPLLLLVLLSMLLLSDRVSVYMSEEEPTDDTLQSFVELPYNRIEPGAGDITLMETELVWYCYCRCTKFPFVGKYDIRSGSTTNQQIYPENVYIS